MGTKAAPVYNYSMMKTNDVLKAEFERHVAQNLNESECDVNDASESLSRLRNSMSSAAEKVLPVVKPIRLRRRCVGDRTQHLYDERKRKFESSTPPERKAASTAIMMSSREDYRSYIDGILDDMEAAERKGNMREISRLTKILSGKKSSSVSPSKDVHGKPIMSTDQLLSSWKEFMSAKFASPDNDRPKEHIVSEEDNLSDDELEACFKALNKNRKAGWDNIPIEGYDGSLSAKQELFRIVRLIWDSELPPPDLVRGIFIMLYKKADRNDFANYRAICLLCHAYKLLSAVISRRMQVPLEAILPDSQAGFRPARGARDNVCILKWTIDMLLRESREAVVTFIDYTAAFDTLSHAFLDQALNQASVSCKLRRIIQAIYTAATGCVRIRQHDGTIVDSEPFDIARGVLQGDIFSSSAFIVGLWRTLTKHDLPDVGVTVGVAPYAVTISKLEYADDIAFLDLDANAASIRITSISRGSSSDASMSISIKKTKAMHVHAKEKVSPTTEAEVIALKLKAKCPDCERTFKNERGMKIHRARWCDGGVTIRS
ncbi:MAG: reverse transcriptase domain-containing protein, partial [Candidatus Poseidoniia archaeon]